MVLRVDNLTLARGGIPVLSGLSFGIEAGQALILRGPNGSGKTTLLRTIAGLQPPVAGEVHMDPESVAYAGHADGIKSMLSVAENLQFWAQVYGKLGIDQALESYALTPLSKRLAGNLSAGQKRRLGLARLLVTGRRLWVLDEPTVSLDASAVTMFAKAVETHLASGGATLIATHIDLGLAAEVLDIGPHKTVTGAHHGASDEAFL